MHHVAVALDVAVVLDPHGAGATDPTQIVATQVDEHQVLGAFLLVGEELLLEKQILLLGVSAPPGPGDRVGGRPAVLDGHQRLRAGADDREVQTAVGVGDVQQVHVRAGIGDPQHPVDVKRIGVGVHLEPLGRDHLERFPGLDVADQLVDDRGVLLDGALGAVRGCRPAERGHRGLQRFGQRRGHHIQAGDGVVIRPVDALVGAVPVHRVGDQRDGAFVVVDRGDVGGQQQHHVRQAEVVDGEFGQPFEAADHVVGEVADQARRQRRQAGQRGGLQQRERGAQRLQRVTTGRRILRDRAQPHRRTVTHGQRGRGTSADERPARPGPAVLRGLQQERSGTVRGQLAVRRERRLAVGEHLSRHRHHAVLGGQRPEVLPRRRRGMR